MTRTTYLTLTILGLLVLPLAAQKPQITDPLTDREVDEAILLGRANRLDRVSTSCLGEKPRTAIASGSLGVASLPFALHDDAVTRESVFVIDLMSAPGVIARAAWAATKAGQPFSKTDVPAAWRLPAIYVHIAPKLANPDGDDKAIIPRATVWNVFLITASVLYRPVTLFTQGPLEVTPRVWKNGEGATVEYVEVATHFVAKEIMILPRNDGFARTSTTAQGEPGTKILLDTDLGERSCRIDTGRIQNLLKR